MPDETVDQLRGRPDENHEADIANLFEWVNDLQRRLDVLEDNWRSIADEVTTHSKLLAKMLSWHYEQIYRELQHAGELDRLGGDLDVCTTCGDILPREQMAEHRCSKRRSQPETSRSAGGVSEPLRCPGCGAEIIGDPGLCEDCDPEMSS